MLGDSVNVSWQDNDYVTLLNIVSCEVHSHISLAFFDIDNLHKFMPVQRHRIEVKWYGAQVSIVWKHRVRMGLILQKIFVFKTVHITMCLLFVNSTIFYSFYILYIIKMIELYN